MVVNEKKNFVRMSWKIIIMHSDYGRIVTYFHPQ